MRKTILFCLLILVPAVLAAQEFIDRIEIAGNEKVARDTILYYLSSKEGDYYNEDMLRKDFKVLWTTGFFANIKIEGLDTPRGKVVRITVEENPVIKTITYKTGKKVKENDIVNKLKEKDAYLLPYSYYSANKIQRIQKTITDLLEEKGLQAAKVDVATDKKGKNEVEVVFKIDEGPKMRVGEIAFEGRTKIPESILGESMKENQKHSLISWITGKDVFKENKLTEGMQLLKNKLQENGYMEATIGEPRIEEVKKRTIFGFKKQPMKKIIVPVNAGYLYRVGDIAIEGNKATNTEGLRGMIKLVKGEIYNTKAREKAVEKIGELYRNGGYMFAQITPVESLDPKRKIVNVNFNINEGEIAFLRKLDFKGNSYTKDKVIRREMMIREGDPFRFALFKDSILRVRQLGLVDMDKDPDIRPDPEKPTEFDVTVGVKELQRNNIQFSAGYSGYDGTFVALSYSTVNFLGAGENLELTLQYGKRVKNYIFGFTEPYLLDLPINVGLNLHDSYQFYPGLYERKGKGFDFSVGGRLYEYWRANLTYSYEFVDITYDANLGYDPYYFGLTHYNISSLNPSIYRSTIDSPLTPTSGSLYMASLQFSGSFLGGEIDMIKPRLEWTRYQPIMPRHSIGLHVAYQFIKPLGNSSIPYWERFYMGGERDIRGYEIYQIGPRNELGTVIGGEKSLILNAEYIIQVGEGSPLYLIAFYDRGNTVLKNQKLSLKNMYSSTGLEARIFVPALRVPFRLIFAYNNPKIYSDDSNFAFRFAIGTTF